MSITYLATSGVTYAALQITPDAVWVRWEQVTLWRQTGSAVAGSIARHPPGNGLSSMFGSPRFGGNNPKRLLIHNLSLNLRRAMKFIRHNATGASAITVR